MNPLQIRAVLGRKQWGLPAPFGPDGWKFLRRDRRASVLVTRAFHDDGAEWIHASIGHHDQTMPEYSELVRLHQAAFGNGYAYQVFVPRAEHVNIHEYALHLWGRADGAPLLPQFALDGSI